MDVLRRSLQLGERCNSDPARIGGRMINFEEQRAVGLDDERPGAIERCRHQCCLCSVADSSSAGGVRWVR